MTVHASKRREKSSNSDFAAAAAAATPSLLLLSNLNGGTVPSSSLVALGITIGVATPRPSLLYAYWWFWWVSWCSPASSKSCGRPRQATNLSPTSAATYTRPYFPRTHPIPPIVSGSIWNIVRKFPYLYYIAYNIIQNISHTFLHLNFLHYIRCHHCQAKHLQSNKLHCVWVPYFLSWHSTWLWHGLIFSFWVCQTINWWMACSICNGVQHFAPFACMLPKWNIRSYFTTQYSSLVCNISQSFQMRCCTERYAWLVDTSLKQRPWLAYFFHCRALVELMKAKPKDCTTLIFI